MILLSRQLWLAQTNTYLLAAERGGPGVIIDAPPDPEAILDMVDEADILPAALVLTHGHIDHMGGAETVAERTGADVYVHRDDDFLTRDPETQLRSLFGMVPPGDFRSPEHVTDLVDGKTLEVGGTELEVVHTPGHTPGHCCFLVAAEGLLFAGDQLFAGSIGRTDLPGGDLEALARSMRDRVMSLEDETRVLPGHGPETTVGQERRGNPFRYLWD